MNLDDALTRLFDAERAAREAEREILKADPKAVVATLKGAVDATLGAEPSDESGGRLARLADLCAQVPGPEMADALIAILGHSDPAVRVEAGEALLDVAYARFKTVAKAVERALDRGETSIAMQELPFILSEVRDPDPFQLIARFLEHEEAEIVASAIEALSALGDPGAIPLLEKLVDDPREATLADVDEEPVAIGQLAQAALEDEFGIGESDEHDS